VVEKSDLWDFTLSYLAFDKGIAIEFEIDYRDLDLFVLITLLENGDLPKGYYMNDGKPVRVHLEKLFESGRIKIGDWKKISNIRCELKDQNELKILIILDAYCTLLLEVASEIQQLSSDIF
ncbi:MAG: hypothetical protein RSD17_04170, partial [Oscillospiraceae bacterium]